jgi:hypothetical protein
VILGREGGEGGEGEMGNSRDFDRFIPDHAMIDTRTIIIRASLQNMPRTSQYSKKEFVFLYIST